MTLQQENHLEAIKYLFSRLADTKYRRGQAEHGGNLFEMNAEQLVDCAIDEAIDQVIYLLTLKDTLESSKNNKLVHSCRIK
jgi:hypothetical protein